jgi:membrane protease YdiL (CAAX protease family)
MAFAVINPFFEETFWRGFMISFNDRIGATFKIISSSLLFTASHPMMWGVFSYGSRSYVALISIFIMGLAWAFTFHKSKNLFWQYISHVMVDIFNVSVLVLMNIYVP